MVLDSLRAEKITAHEATVALGALRVRVRDELWSVRADTQLAVLIRTTADGHTAVMKETPSFTKRWWPLLPLVVLSALALWGFATSTAQEAREDVGVTPTTSVASGRP